MKLIKRIKGSRYNSGFFQKVFSHNKRTQNTECKKDKTHWVDFATDLHVWHA